MIESETFGIVLAEVREIGPATAAQVAENVGLPESTVRRVLKRLEENGAIESDAYYEPARRGGRRGRSYAATEEA